MSAPPAICARCGRSLPADAPEGLCPACLVAGCFDELAPEVKPAGRTDVLFQFGDYEVLKEIGRGGMGVVYLARQISLNRQVALKCIQASALGREANLRRFQIEAKAAAKLQHPRIVAIHEVGEHAGDHWLSMDYVAGSSLASRLNGRPLAPRQAAAWMAQTAEAIQHAHQRGVLHRDLKPSNILIDEAGEPRITDFGLAKLLDADSEVTQSGTILGSPHYMAPEQATGQMRHVDARTDVYALGATLYECLTGRPPFAAPTPLETLRLVVEQEPVPPRALNPSIPRDLETVCLKCLAKTPAARYAGAQELADDLRRFERDEPVRARPASAFEKAWRWCRRKPALAAALAAVVVVAFVGALLTLRQWRRAERNAVAERRQRELAQKRLFAADTQLAYQLWANENFGAARVWLAAHAQESNLHDFAWRYLWNRCQGDHLAVLPGHTSLVSQLAISPHGRLLASREWGRVLKVWDLATRREIWSRGGVRALGGFANATTLVAGETEEAVVLLEAQTGRLLQRWAVEGQLFEVLPGQGAFATTATNFLLRIWDLDTGALRAALPGRRVSRGAVDADCPRVKLTTDGSKLALIDFGEPEQVAVWEVASSQCRMVRAVPRPFSLMFSADGSQWFVGDRNGQVHVGEIPSNQLRSWTAHGSTVSALAVSPDGTELITGHDSQVVHRWALREGELIETWRGEEQGTSALAFSPKGEVLVSGSVDGRLRLWARDREPAVRTRAGFQTGWQTPADNLVVSPDGRLVAVAQTNRGVRVLLASGLRGLGVLPDAGIPLGFLEEAQRLLTLDGLTLCVWNWGATSIVSKVEVPAQTRAARIALLSPDRRSVLFVHQSSDGRHDEFRLCATADGRETACWVLPDRWFKRATFSGDGRAVLGTDDAGEVHWWSVPEGHRLRTIAAHTPQTNARDFVAPLAMSPDGLTIATGGMDGVVKLWEVASSQECARLLSHGSIVLDAAFSPDGRTLATADLTGSIRLWNLELSREIGSLDLSLSALVTRESGIKRLGFAARGDTLLAFNWRGQLKSWSVERVPSP